MKAAKTLANFSFCKDYAVPAFRDSRVYNVPLKEAAQREEIVFLETSITSTFAPFSMFHEN